VLCLCVGVGSACLGKVIYVDVDAHGANDGSSWADAYKYLQDAVVDANASAKPVYIMVAQGIYRPDEDALHPDGTGDREATFQLINGVTLQAGYAGLGELDPNARDTGLYETILSGDLDSNDVDVNDICELLTDATRAENSYNVVRSIENDANAGIDGFIITGGNANDSYSSEHRNRSLGGGMHARESSAVVYACTYCANSATWDGGGVFNDMGNLTLDSCAFRHNYAYLGGGVNSGPYDYSSAPTLVDCSFSENSAESGGGLYDGGYGPHTLTNCSFIANSAVLGGGIYSEQNREVSYKNCVFVANTASERGGSMYMYCCDLTLTGCMFWANSAEMGGAIHSRYCPAGGPVLQDCIFEENAAGWGGAIDIHDNSPTLVNCQFIANKASKTGGGMNLDTVARDAIITDSTFTGNWAGLAGGGIYNGWRSASVLTGCLFSGNSADHNGGAVYLEGGHSTMYKCLFLGNAASQAGGAIGSEYSTHAASNCLFVDNLAYRGEALAFDSVYQDDDPSRSRIRNSIMWNGENAIWNNNGSTIVISFSDIQGGWPGEGNIDVDPCFADPGYWDPNGTPGDVDDDFWVDGDYHLKSQAGRWDSNDGRWVRDDMTSPCIDAGDPMSPIGDEPFPNGGIINMGAYGGTAEASKSYFGEPPCETIVAGDINGDCAVNFEDFRLMALHWLEEH